MVKKVSGI